MKILYIYVEGKDNLGVIKKIEGQVKAFKSLGNDIDVLNYDNKKVFFNKKELFGAGNKYLKRFLIFIKLKKINLNEYELIYLRSPGLNPCVINFLKNCKKKYLDQKIILEIPTYPYDKEDFNMVTKIYNYIDKISRRNLYKYIDKIVTYSDDRRIFGIPCINISNGLDLNEITLSKKEKNKNITFTSVSLCFFWHGIDRFLYSLLEYIKNDDCKDNIIFNIVGQGTETFKLKKIVENNSQLKNCVIFHGFKSGKELDEIYNKTDIAVGCLGNHRKGISYIQALKNREYAAKGLPMIFSENDPGFKNVDFVFKASEDEELLNINEIIKWYKNLKANPQQIREYSKRFSWEKQINIILNELKKETNYEK